MSSTQQRRRRPRTTINSLPLELIQLIVNDVQYGPHGARAAAYEQLMRGMRGMGLPMEGRGREEDGEEGGGDEAGLGLIADLFFGALMGGGNSRPGLAPAAGQANANANGGRGNGNGNGPNIAAARRDPVTTPTPTPASVATGSATPVVSTGPIRPAGGSVDPLRDYLSATSVRPVVVTRDDDSDGDDEDEDEEETDEEDEDEDEDDEQDRFFGGSHREMIYPDGLPTDSMVPLSFVSRK